MSVVSVLAREHAGGLESPDPAGGHTGIVLRPGRLGPINRWRRGPRPPADTETSIEAPYRLQVSPSRFGAFTHDPAPTRSPVDPTRTELWRTHLTVRTEDADGAFTGLDDTDDTQRIVRAVWTRDLDAADADPHRWRGRVASQVPHDGRGVRRVVASPRGGLALGPAGHGSPARRTCDAARPVPAGEGAARLFDAIRSG